MLQLVSLIAMCVSLTLFASTTRFTGARILLDHQILPGELWVQDGKIIAPQLYADTHIDLEGKKEVEEDVVAYTDESEKVEVGVSAEETK